LKPIQLANFSLEEFREGRRHFTRDEWLDLLVRSIGLEPAHFSRRLKLFFLTRLIPMVERNFNFVELGPRGTGKSFVYREVSPYSILVSGGKTTVANLFYNMATNKIGLVGLWDVVAFDEVAGIHFGDKTAVQILKDYMEAGSFSRGKEELVADASLVFVGNTNIAIDVLVRTNHLFQPLPEAMRDMALIDRFHFYLPGWETPKMSASHFTDHYGFVVDYLAEAMRELRRHNFAEALDKYYSLGAHLNARDSKAVRKTLGGLLKLLHPDGSWTREELQEYLELAIEGRRRVKEQLKKIGAFEYHQVSFSYIDHETREERFVGVPEEGGHALITSDPLPPGCAYTADIGGENRAVIYRIEVSKIAGSGRLKITGNLSKATRESITTVFDHLRSRARELGIATELGGYDFPVQVVNLTPGRDEESSIGMAFFVALYSLIKMKPVLSGLVILGGVTIQGRLVPARMLSETLQSIMDNGAKRVLIPVENKRHLFDVSADIIEKVDPIFYSDPLTATAKALAIS
jgi:ATP-dependent Lon protease